MSIEDIRGLRLEWFGSRNNPKPFAHALNRAFDEIGFSEAYCQRCSASETRRGARSKVVKDNIWGMIELDDPAIRLLDCPVVQRLRRVRQLGFSFLTYPSAEHSRFVHSLGMFGVISRFIQSAQRDREEEAGSPEIHKVNRSDRLDLQHAALLHDSGHLPFSHASEVALQVLPDLTRVGGLELDEFFSGAEEVGLRNPKLAELLSVAIVLSPRFGHFYSNHVRPLDEDKNSREDAHLRVASLIMGKPVDSKNVGYADLISGRVIDADKLDYVSRDGMACGIPTGIDIGRLFLRSEFMRFDKDRLNQLRIRSGYELVDSDQVHFIVNASGRDTIEELISARTSMYHRVYFHHTTRNAERLYEQLIERALAVEVSPKLDLDAVNVWAQSDEQMLAMLLQASDAEVRRLAERISSRQLPKRAVVFGQGELAPLLPFKQAFRRGQIHFDDGPIRLQQLQRFSKRRMFGLKLSELEAAIRAESLRLHAAIHQDLQDNLPAMDEAPHIAVSPAQFSPAVHDDCLVLQNHELVYSRELHNVTQTADAEEIFQASGYVLTDEPWRELVFVAARKVLAERTAEWTDIEARVGGAPAGPGVVGANAEVVTSDAFTVLNLDHEKVIGRASLNASKVTMIEKCAAKNGYFDSFPFLMSRPDIQWEKVHERFERFEGQYGWEISRQVAETFVWQFPPQFRRHAVELLHAVEVLDSATSVILVRNALAEFRTKVRHRGRIRIAPLTPNSGQELRIALETTQRSNEEFSRDYSLHHSLAELLAADPRSESPIALIDDNVVSASQSFAQIATWLGVPREQWPVALSKETNIEDVPLTEESQQRLLEALSVNRVGLCVSIGSHVRSLENRRQLVRLIEQKSNGSSLEQEGLFTENLAAPDLSLFTGRDTASADHKVLRDPKFLTFLEAAGRSVLAWSRHRRTFEELAGEERKECQRDALGYDGARGLVFTFRNVPVSTLTCLWAPGKVNDLPWMPLGLRRGYGKRVVLT